MNSLNHITSTIASLPPIASNANLNFIEKMFLSARSSEYAGQHDFVFMSIFWLSVVFFFLVMGPFTYFIIKYRRKPGVAPQRSVSHNTPLELAWSLIPLLLLCVLFFMGFEVYIRGQIAPANAETINVRAKKWSWTFAYDNGAQTKEFVDLVGVDVPVFAVPAGKPVRLIMDSEDVIHSLYVPDFRKKIDIYPNRYTTMWFEASHAGETHYIFCAEFCGDQHSQMAAILNVLSPLEYEQWKKNNLTDPSTLFPADWGAMLYKQHGCNQCHSVDEAKTAKVGPAWWGIWGKKVAIEGGGEVIVDENYIRESIYDPGAKLVAGYANQMSSYQKDIGPDKLTAIIDYMKTLSPEGQASYEADKKAWLEAKDAARNANDDTTGQ